VTTLANRLRAAALAALIVGGLTGVAARILMRLIKLAFDRPVEFSLPGTAIILLVFVVALMPAALCSALARRSGWVHRAIRASGVLLSAGYLFVVAAQMAIEDGTESFPGLPGFRVALVVALFAVFAAVIVLAALVTARVAARLSDRFTVRAPRPEAIELASVL